MHCKTNTLILVLTACMASCGSNQTTASVELVLTPDPALAPMVEVLAQVRSLQVIVDCEQGLNHVEQPGKRSSGGIAVDWDQDGELEVIFEVTVPKASTLPVLEIGLEHNANKQIEFRIFGFSAEHDMDKGNMVACGSVTTLCDVGKTHRVGTPFNLLAKARRPKVVMVLPPDQEEVPRNTAAAFVMFSTMVETSSLEGNVSILKPDQTVLPVSLNLETMVFPSQDGTQEDRSWLEIFFEQELVHGTYSLNILPGIESSAGNVFDQDPTTSEPDNFASQFDAYVEPVGGGYGDCAYCTSDQVCHPVKLVCVPALDCSFGCESGFVCDPNENLCVEDCRVYGMCADEHSQCDEETGFCE